MNDKNKKIHWFCNILIVFVLLSAGLLLFDLIQHFRGSASDTGGKLERAQVEQRAAEETVRKIGDGLDESIRGVRELGEGTRSAQESAERIGESNSAIRESIDESQEIRNIGRTVTDDSERRITICESILEKIRNEKR